jgi:hypothetical protein
MSVSIKAPAVVFCLVLVIPLLAAPALSASAPKTMPAPGRYKISDFVKAQAFVDPLRPARSTLPSDGLGRDDSECNMGCVDH